VHDSTVINLPDELCDVWPGCGNQTDQAQAALKIQVQWDLRSGTLKLLTLHSGREQDRSAPVQTAPVVPGSLRLADLGYFDLSSFAHIGQAQAYWITRYLSGVNLYSADAKSNAKPIDLPEWLERQCTQSMSVDVPVLVGSMHRLPARLKVARCGAIAIRVPQQVAEGGPAPRTGREASRGHERRRKLHETARRKGKTVSQLSLVLADWTIFLTNIPPDLLTVDEILVIARARWQIELLFKLWKSVGHIDESRSCKPYRILCELYAKLTGQVLQHALMLYTCWSYPESGPSRGHRSLVKAAAAKVALRGAIASCATALLLALQATDPAITIMIVVNLIARSVAATCRISPRTKKRATFQLLAIEMP